jgi:sigma-B regulation protein RsbU (phosphoserine phosphatase)
VNAGHNPPFLIRAKQEIELLEEGTTVLGAFNDLPFLNVGVIEDLDKFSICAFTDGLTEILNSTGEEFGNGPLHDVVKSNASKPPSELNESIIAAMKLFKGENGYADDVTLFTCSVDNTHL